MAHQTTNPETCDEFGMALTIEKDALNRLLIATLEKYPDAIDRKSSAQAKKQAWDAVSDTPPFFALPNGKMAAQLWENIRKNYKRSKKEGKRNYKYANELKFFDILESQCVNESSDSESDRSDKRSRHEEDSSGASSSSFKKPVTPANKRQRQADDSSGESSSRILAPGNAFLSLMISIQTAFAINPEATNELCKKLEKDVRVLLKQPPGPSGSIAGGSGSDISSHEKVTMWLDGLSPSI